jgi:hypothetical protein
LWLDNTVGLRDETSFGAPSGHVQIATVIYLYLAIKAKRRLVWFLAIFGILIMALSRVYLGAHFLQDAIAGFILGFLVLVGYFIWQENFHGSFRNRILGQRLLFVIALPLIIALFYAAGLVLIGAAADVEWAEAAQIAERVSLEEAFSAIGVLLGLGIGFILEASRVHFIVDGTPARRALRYVVGMLGVLVIWRGIALILPQDPLWLALPLRLIRYWLAGMWVAYYAPLLFVRIGLAQASPDPDVSLSISRGGIMSE